MSIKENVSQAIQSYKTANQLSLSKLAKLLGIPMSSLQCYLKGTSELRSDTIELLAGKTHISVTEMVSGPASEWKQAETILRAVQEFSRLTPQQQNRSIQLFLELVALFTQDA